MKEPSSKNRKAERWCSGLTKAGEPCRAAATEGGLCFFHANPNKASELGRIGGRKNRHFSTDPASPLPTLDSAIAVQQTVARLVEDLYAGKIHPRIASGLTPLLNLQLRAIETSDLERRLERVERLLADSGVKSDSKKSEQELDDDFRRS